MEGCVCGTTIWGQCQSEAVAGGIVQQVWVLDGLMRYRFGDKSELMGAFACDRNVA